MELLFSYSCPPSISLGEFRESQTCADTGAIVVFILKTLPVYVSQTFSHSCGFSSADVPAKKGACCKVLGMLGPQKNMC